MSTPKTGCWCGGLLLQAVFDWVASCWRQWALVPAGLAPRAQAQWLAAYPQELPLVACFVLS